MHTAFFKNVDATYLSVYLLFCASYKDAPIQTQTGKIMTLKRGQFLGGRRRLSQELGWGIIRVRRALKVLKDANFLTLFTTNNIAVITVSNYNSYQGVGSPQDQGGISSRPQGGSAQDLRGDQLETRYKNVKNVKKQTTLVVGSKEFDFLWDLYPRKVGKKTSVGYMRSSIKTKQDVLDCQRAIDHYKTSRAVKNGFVQYGTTFFNNWRDWVTDPDPGRDPEFDEMDKLLKKGK